MAPGYAPTCFPPVFWRRSTVYGHQFFCPTTTGLNPPQALLSKRAASGGAQGMERDRILGGVNCMKIRSILSWDLPWDPQVWIQLLPQVKLEGWNLDANRWKNGPPQVCTQVPLQPNYPPASRGGTSPYSAYNTSVPFRNFYARMIVQIKPMYCHSYSKIWMNLTYITKLGLLVLWVSLFYKYNKNIGLLYKKVLCLGALNRCSNIYLQFRVTGFMGFYIL